MRKEDNGPIKSRDGKVPKNQRFRFPTIDYS